MNVIRKMQIKFVAVFMAVMLVAAAAISSVIYFQRRTQLNYDCMVYLLNVHNFDNKQGSSDPKLAAYPPYFVIEIDNHTNTSRVVMGQYFLADKGVSTDKLIAHLAGNTDESGILEEYSVRYFNGVRQDGAHRVSFMDVSYIDNTLHSLLGRIVLVALPSLAAMLAVSLLLARWYSQPAARAMEEQTRFISKVSHELKTPLSVIRANVDLIDQGKGVNETDFVFGCENIRQECGRMNSLIEAMLWAALPAHRDSEGQKIIDLTRLLEGEMLRFEVLAFDHGLKLALTAEEGLKLRGDETQITRLIDIIMDNAVKYCSAGGEIAVTAEKRSGPGQRVKITVANTGEPLDKKQIENIFKPFYQQDGTNYGAGLGLAIANEIVTAMHGSIHVDSAGGVNRFIIEL